MKKLETKLQLLSGWGKRRCNCKSICPARREGFFDWS